MATSLEMLSFLTAVRRYVIANNTIETPPAGPEVYDALLEGALPKLPVNVITLEQALDALSRSGPAVY